MLWKDFKVSELLKINTLYSIFDTHYDYGYKFYGEIHSFWEFLYVANGEVLVTADNKIINLKQGSIIFHKPHEFHKLEIECKNGADVFISSFSLSGKLSSFFSNKIFILNDNQKSIVNLCLTYINSENTYTSSDSLYKYLSDSNTEIYRNIISTNIILLLLSLADNGTESTDSVTTSETIEFSKAVEFMNENIYSKITVKEIASHCNISQSGLKRIFLKYTGLGVHKYYLNLKFKTASQLLSNGYTVTEVSDMLNFSSQAYFSAAFKREFKTTPKSLKK